jgi:ankyrin repeat protein
MAAELHDAIARNDVECVKSLLNKTSSSSKDEEVALVNSVHGDGFDSRTALSRAAEIGAIDIVRLLLDRGAVASATDVNGGTAIWFASERGHASVVALLKERGALVNDNAEDSGDYDHAGLDFD